MKFDNNILNSGLYAGLVKVAQNWWESGWEWGADPKDPTKGYVTHPKIPAFRGELPPRAHATGADYQRYIDTYKSVRGPNAAPITNPIHAFMLDNIGKDNWEGDLARFSYNTYSDAQGFKNHEAIFNMFGNQEGSTTPTTAQNKNVPEQKNIWERYKPYAQSAWNNMSDKAKWGVGIGGGLLGGMAAYGLYSGLRNVLGGGYDDDDDY